MALYEMTPDELQSVLGWLNDEEGHKSPPEAAAKLINISTRLQKKLLDDALRSGREAAGYRRRLERIASKNEAAAAAGDFKDLGFDSVDVARCLLHCLQEMGMFCSRNKLIHLVYVAYASWLASKGERICIEHPVATEWGPNYWRVYKHIASPAAIVPYDAFKTIAERNSGLAVFLRNVARKYGDYRDGDLERYVCGKPYKNALPEHNDGKWNKVIADADIYEWKAAEEGR